MDIRCVFRDELGNADAWKNAVVDLSMYAGRPDVRLSWTVWVSTPQGWQCDIALDNIVVDGTGGGGGTLCATIPYDQNFETGSNWYDRYFRFTIFGGYRCKSS